MFSWMRKSGAAQGPIVEPAGSTTGAERQGPTIATSHDSLLRRAVVGTLAAAITSSAGHREACTQCVGIIQSCLESSSREIAASIAAFKSDGISARSIDSLCAYVVQLHFAERLTEALTETSEPVAHEPANWSLLIDAWSAAAEGALRVVTHLQSESGIKPERRQFYGAVHLIASSMHPHPPPRACQPERESSEHERRDSHRYLVGSWIQIAGPAGVSAAFLVDISLAGFGFATPAAIAPGDTIEAEFGDRRILAARVVWVRGTRVGASFLTPLRPGDPLLLALTAPLGRFADTRWQATLVTPDG